MGSIVEQHPALDARIMQAGRLLPDWWIENILGAKPWLKQREIARSTFRNKRTVVPSAEGTGKSYIAGRIAVCYLCNYAPSTVITTGPTSRQVKDILWREIGTAHAGAKLVLPGEVFKQKIDIETDWFAFGFSTDQQERFQGYHNENVLVIVDEASGVPDTVYEGIENSLAVGDTHLLLIGNPTQPVGRFREAAASQLYNCIQISAFDTPNFTTFGITMDDIRQGTWESKITGEFPAPYLMKPDRVAERYDEWGEGAYLFQAMVLGRFPDAGVNTLFPLHLIDAAMRRKPTGTGEPKVAAVDISRYGDDETVLGERQGDEITPLISWGHHDTMYTAGRVARNLKVFKPVVTRVDTVGVGAGPGDRLREIGYRIEDFDSGSRALDSEQYLNKRAEGYATLLRKLENAELTLPNDAKLKAQLADIRYKFNSRGKLQLESKEEARSRGSKSPDRADTVMMLAQDARFQSAGPVVYRD